jgi:hypothetical protein
MQCFICGEQMRVVRVEPHAVDMQGFELRTFQCIGCGDVEKRPVFDRAHSLHPEVPEATPIAAAAPLPPPATVPAPEIKAKKSIFSGLVRLRTPQT